MEYAPILREDDSKAPVFILNDDRSSEPTPCRVDKDRVSWTQIVAVVKPKLTIALVVAPPESDPYDDQQHQQPSS